MTIPLQWQQVKEDSVKADSVKADNVKDLDQNRTLPHLDPLDGVLKLQTMPITSLLFKERPSGGAAIVNAIVLKKLECTTELIPPHIIKDPNLVIPTSQVPAIRRKRKTLLRMMPLQSK
jgi:hypothetical protein